MRIADTVGLVVALLALSCSGPTDTRADRTTTSPANPDTTVPVATTRTTIAVHPQPFGQRSFHVKSVHLAPGATLTIALHPTRQPVQIEATPDAAVEVCPATLDGNIAFQGSSWPVPFRSCFPLDASGRGRLPATDGTFHVAFALRSRNQTDTVVVDISVSYSASDAFVEIGRSAGSATTTVVFTPRSTTVGALAYLEPGSRSAPDALLTVEQSGRSLTSANSCDFGSEIACVGDVVPGRPVSAFLSGGNAPGTRLVMFLAWR